MRPRAHVILDVILHDVPQSCGAHHLLDLHGREGGGDSVECAVAIVQQIGRAFLVGKGVAELLCRPRGCRVIGDRDMHDEL